MAPRVRWRRGAGGRGGGGAGRRRRGRRGQAAAPASVEAAVARGRGRRAGGSAVAAGAAAAAGRPDAAARAGSRMTVYVAGDSTVQTYTGSSIHQGGWGQFLDDYFTTQVTVDNRAIGGRTSRRFIEEGRLTTILDESARATTCSSSSAPTTATDRHLRRRRALLPGARHRLQEWMQMYIDGAKSKGAIPRAGDAAAAQLLPQRRRVVQLLVHRLRHGDEGARPDNSVRRHRSRRRAVTYLNGKADCDWASANFFLAAPTAPSTARTSRRGREHPRQPGREGRRALAAYLK